MTRPRGATSEAGFTLIELLVTVTLLSMLMLLLFGGLRFGVRAWDGSQAHGVRTDELRVVQGLLRRAIEQAYPAYNTADPTHPVVDFRGGEDSLTFLAPAPQAAEAIGRSRIAVTAERDGGRLQLVMHGVPELDAGQGNAWSAPLVRNVAAVQFAFFDSGQWRPAWTHKDALPALVRLRVTFRAGDGRVWPDLIVAPRIAADAGCVYDYTTTRCQGRP